MKLFEFAVENNPKDTLIETLKKYQDKRIIIMMSSEVYEKFTESSDVRFIMCDNGDHCVSNDEIYEVYENEKIRICQRYGIAVFELICGVFILKTFSSEMFKYANSDEEAELCIYLKKK